MMPERRAVCDRVEDWRALVTRCVQPWAIDPVFVLAVIAEESRGNPWAIRPEPAFWHRYGERFIAEAPAHARPWTRHPDIASSSYGLMQVLYVTAVEYGFDGEYPTELCDPFTGVRFGWEKLRACLARAARESDPQGAALLIYNGGGDPDYPVRVRAWQDDLAALWTGDAA